MKEKYNIPLILLSIGKEGSRAYWKDCCVEVPAFIQKNTIETTGAGDTFLGSCLHFTAKIVRTENIVYIGSANYSNVCGVLITGFIFNVIARILLYNNFITCLQQFKTVEICSTCNTTLMLVQKSSSNMKIL